MSSITHNTSPGPNTPTQKALSPQTPTTPSQNPSTSPKSLPITPSKLHQLPQNLQSAIRDLDTSRSSLNTHWEQYKQSHRHNSTFKVPVPGQYYNQYTSPSIPRASSAGSGTGNNGNSGTPTLSARLTTNTANNNNNATIFSLRSGPSSRSESNNSSNTTNTTPLSSQFTISLKQDKIPPQPSPSHFPSPFAPSPKFAERPNPTNTSQEHKRDQNDIDDFLDFGDEDLEAKIFSKVPAKSTTSIPEVHRDGKLVKIDPYQQQQTTQIVKNKEILLSLQQLTLNNQNSNNNEESSRNPGGGYDGMATPQISDRAVLHDLTQVINLMYHVDEPTWLKYYMPLCQYFHDLLFHPNSTKHVPFLLNNDRKIAHNTSNPAITASQRVHVNASYFEDPYSTKQLKLQAYSDANNNNNRNSSNNPNKMSSSKPTTANQASSASFTFGNTQKPRRISNTPSSKDDSSTPNNTTSTLNHGHGYGFYPPRLNVVKHSKHVIDRTTDTDYQQLDSGLMKSQYTPIRFSIKGRRVPNSDDDGRNINSPVGYNHNNNDSDDNGNYETLSVFDDSDSELSHEIDEMFNKVDNGGIPKIKVITTEHKKVKKKMAKNNAMNKNSNNYDNIPSSPSKPLTKSQKIKTMIDNNPYYDGDESGGTSQQQPPNNNNYDDYDSDDDELTNDNDYMLERVVSQRNILAGRDLAIPAGYEVRRGASFSHNDSSGPLLISPCHSPSTAIRKPNGNNNDSTPKNTQKSHKLKKFPVVKQFIPSRNRRTEVIHDPIIVQQEQFILNQLQRNEKANDNNKCGAHDIIIVTNDKNKDIIYRDDIDDIDADQNNITEFIRQGSDDSDPFILQNPSYQLLRSPLQTPAKSPKNLPETKKLSQNGGGDDDNDFYDDITMPLEFQTDENWIDPFDDAQKIATPIQTTPRSRQTRGMSFISPNATTTIVTPSDPSTQPCLSVHREALVQPTTIKPDATHQLPPGVIFYNGKWIHQNDVKKLEAKNAKKLLKLQQGNSNDDGFESDESGWGSSDDESSEEDDSDSDSVDWGTSDDDHATPSKTNTNTTLTNTPVPPNANVMTNASSHLITSPQQSLAAVAARKNLLNQIPTLDRKTLANMVAEGKKQAQLLQNDPLATPTSQGWGGSSGSSTMGPINVLNSPAHHHSLSHHTLKKGLRGQNPITNGSKHPARVTALGSVLQEAIDDEDLFLLGDNISTESGLAVQHLTQPKRAESSVIFDLDALSSDNESTRTDSPHGSLKTNNNSSKLLKNLDSNSDAGSTHSNISNHFQQQQQQQQQHHHPRPATAYHEAPEKQSSHTSNNNLHHGLKEISSHQKDQLKLDKSHKNDKHDKKSRKSSSRTHDKKATLSSTTLEPRTLKQQLIMLSADDMDAFIDEDSGNAKKIEKLSSSEKRERSRENTAEENHAQRELYEFELPDSLLQTLLQTEQHHFGMF